MTTLTIEHHNILRTKAAVVRETIKHNKKTKPNQKPSISHSLKTLALFMDSQFVKILLQLILLFVENEVFNNKNTPNSSGWKFILKSFGRKKIQSKTFTNHHPDFIILKYRNTMIVSNCC